MKKYYVTMNDKTLSGWGGAVGRISKFIIECDTLEQAEEVEAVARRDHWNMKHIHIHDKLPYYPASKYHISMKNYYHCTAFHYNHK